MDILNLPLVTIAIPAYKGWFLSQAIESAIAQTYRNIEILVVNDCSKENLDNIVLSYTDKHIRYVRNEQNLGGANPARNWNRCVELAQGEYFALLCDDDVFSPDFVEQMMALAITHPQCSVFRARACFINKDGQVVNYYPSAPQYESVKDYMWHVFNFYRYQTISEFLIRTETIRKHGGYAYLPIAWYADYVSIYRFAGENGIVSTSNILVSFRQSGENISSQDSKNTLEKLQASYMYIDIVTGILQKMSLSGEEMRRMIDLLNHHVFRNTKYHLQRAQWGVLWKLLFTYRSYRISRAHVWNAILHHKR